jgi:two-component system, OmpR family, phosphate regulon sensor histidine kinase PhoR
MQRRIRWRIALPYLVLLVVTMTVFSLLITSHIRQEEEALWREKLLAVAHLVARQARDAYATQGEALRLSNLARNSSETLGMEVFFYTRQGDLLASSLPREDQPEPPLGLIEDASVLEREERVSIEDGAMVVAVPVQSVTGEILGLLQLQAPLSALRIDLGRLIWLGLAVVVISAAVVIMIALLVSDLSLKPVEALTTAAQQMSMGNFKHIEIPEAPLELADLSQALRIMAVQLGAQIDALTSERAKLSAVLNQMTDGVLIADADGRVQLLNPAAERLFQIKETVGLGRSVVEVMRYHQLVELWQKAKAGQRQSTTLEIGPQHLFLQVVGIPLKTALPGSTMLLFQDLTQLRRLETVRRDFISNVSHELRTPLASLKALAETLQEGALEDPPAARRFIIRMETEIDNLTQLVNELLELSRIESGKVPLSFQRIFPCDLLMPAIERMALQAERAGLELSMDCQPGLPQVFADPDRITQVMINLIHNAVKFTPPGGKISVSAYQDGDHIVFFVRDTGVGIARKDLSRIFERFYKADRARTGGGTGLGLSIARHMIEAHGGYIWAESEEGVGSTFYFTLPVA